MNHKQKLLEIHQKSLTGKLNLTSDLIKDLDFVDSIIESQKALFTILITLAVHKILNPKQDIRNHKKEIKDGFSGRTIDTEHITPTLRELVNNLIPSIKIFLERLKKVKKNSYQL